MGSFPEKASIPPLNSTDKTVLPRSPPTTEREHRSLSNTGRQQSTHSTGDLHRPERQGKIRTRGGGWGAEQHSPSYHRKRGKIRSCKSYLQEIAQVIHRYQMLILCWF